MQRTRVQWRYVAALWVVLLAISGCGAQMTQALEPTELYAHITMPANPIRLEPARNAPIIGLVFQGARLPLTGKMSNCEWLKVKLPPTLQQFGSEGWIVGPPEFALIDGGGCADIPDLTPRPTPAG